MKSDNEQWFNHIQTYQLANTPTSQKNKEQNIVKFYQNGKKLPTTISNSPPQIKNETPE